MRPTLSILCLGLLVLTGAGCGTSNQARYLIEPPAPSAKVSLPVATIELREVTLPAYAASIDISRQDADGALRSVAGTLWADDPVRGVTSALARSLDQATTASVAASPWPLSEPAQAELDVRVEEMLAGHDGQFRLKGLYAVSSPDGILRDRIRRFDIAIPIAGEGPAAIAAAGGASIAALAAEIAAGLKR